MGAGLHVLILTKLEPGHFVIHSLGVFSRR
jgi:hypothetical protein